jgi:hypothetical protein
MACSGVGVSLGVGVSEGVGVSDAVGDTVGVKVVVGVGVSFAVEVAVGGSGEVVAVGGIGVAGPQPVMTTSASAASKAVTFIAASLLTVLSFVMEGCLRARMSFGEGIIEMRVMAGKFELERVMVI